MKSLRTKLVRAFILEVMGFVFFGIILSLLQVNATNKYRDIANNMVSEYGLTSTAYSLINEFNNYALNSSSTSIASDKASIDSSEKMINGLYGVLDKNVSGTSSLSSYIGLKNTINSLVTEINMGVTQYSEGNYIAQSSYNQANVLYGFVATDSGTFINNSLARIPTIQAQVNKTYKVSVIGGIVVFVFVILGTIIYTRKFSDGIIDPLGRLTTTAEQISGGDMTTTIATDLLDNKDETGRLANAFNLMFLRLKARLMELNGEKTGFEKKVNERTKELNDEKAKLLSSIESLDIGFLLIDIGGAIYLKNRAINDIFGFSETDNITSQGLQELLVSVDFDKITQQVLVGLSVTLNKVALGPKILKIYIGPVLADGANSHKENLGWVVLIEDITEATILERSKDEFFSIASHELRTPLTSIKGNASMIMDYYKDALQNVDLKEMVDDIHTSAVRLIDIVNDFLDISRLEQGKMSFNYAATSLEKVVEGVAYEMKVVLNEKKIYLKIDKLTLGTLPKVWADENRLKQVIYNLIGNAAKFTEEGGITITTEVGGDNKFIKVILSDTGRGMTAESQQLLFHKFQQASSSLLTRDTTRGTGLGLYISKMIVENMGGKIALESSAVDKGSVFSFTVNIATPQQLASSVAATGGVDSTTGLTANNAAEVQPSAQDDSQP
jgi:signal transduction histidine kinase/HAMP domain-containing protein